MRRFLALCIVILCIFPSCGSGENDFTYDLSTSPLNLDPQSASDPSSLQIISSIFQGLTAKNKDGDIVLSAAEKCVVTDNGLVYRFQLREDLCWQDGEKVTAEDFVYAFQRLLSYETQAPDASNFFFLENAEAVYHKTASPDALGVYADGEETVVFVLTEKRDDFLSLLATAAAMPCDRAFFESTHGKYGLEEDMILGNGAFYVSIWRDGYLRLRKSATYFDADQVTANSVLFSFLDENEDDPKKRFLSGTTCAYLSQDDLVLSDAYGVEKKENILCGIVFSKTGAFADRDLRLALGYACERQRLEDLLGDKGTVAYGVIPGGVAFGGGLYRNVVSEEITLPYDEQAALSAYRNWLQNHPEGLSSLTVIIEEGSGNEGYFSELSQSWQRDLSLFFTVEVLPKKDFDRRLESGNYDCAVLSFGGKQEDPSSYFLDLFPSEASYFTPSEDFYSLVDQGKQEENEEKYRQAESLLVDEGILLPLYYRFSYFYQNRKVGGLTYDFDTGIIDFKEGFFS